METIDSEDIARVRDVLEKFGKLPVPVTDLDDSADLYDNGLTSHASLRLEPPYLLTN